MIFTDVFTMLAEAAGRTTRYVSSCGGTRSGKTYSMLQFLYLLSASDTKPTITSVVSETFPHLKRGAIRDFKAVVGEDWHEDWWSKSDSSYTFPSGAIIEFFSADTPSKVHGPARDRLFLNEVQNIDYDTARQLFVRTKDFIYLDYNPTHSFFVNELIEPLPECVTIHSTYLDNRDRKTGESMLTQAQIREIEGNRERDRNWWRIYGEGRVGQLEGLIYEFGQIDDLPEDDGLVDIYGLDFGYNDPTALIRVKADHDKKVAYLDEIVFESYLTNKELIERMRKEGVGRATEIFCDSAEPKSIAELSLAGFNAKPCYKGKEIVEQIKFVKGWRLMVTKRSVRLIKEFRNYQWLKDRDGRWLNEPDGGIWDHGMDAFRYAMFTKMGQFRKPLNGGRPRMGSAW